MRRIVPCLAVAAALMISLQARGTTVFTTQSTATQTIDSPLLGGAVSLSATGLQVFTIDLAAGTANVTSDLKGTDFPDPLNPGGFLSYDLYNTSATGTVTQNPSGTFNVSFELLFELSITSGLLAGLTFETLDLATFAASDIATLPFPPGTAFSDPTPPDTIVIYVKSDPTGTFPAGAPAGTSSGRVVTINAIVPEPSSLLLCATAGLLGGLVMCRRVVRGRRGTRA